MNREPVFATKTQFMNDQQLSSCLLINFQISVSEERLRLKVLIELRKQFHPYKIKPINKPRVISEYPSAMPLIFDCEKLTELD